MKDLETVRIEIEQALTEEGFAVFHCVHRMDEVTPMISWDTERYPDARDFLRVAKQLDTKLMNYHHRALDSQQLEEAFEKLEVADMTGDGLREAKRSLNRMKSYEGFTCALELSFDYEAYTYFYTVTTSWYDEFLDILDEIDDALDADEDEGPAPMSGYFSQN